jgi:hypothetical protein
VGNLWCERNCLRPVPSPCIAARVGVTGARRVGAKKARRNRGLKAPPLFARFQGRFSVTPASSTQPGLPHAARRARAPQPAAAPSTPAALASHRSADGARGRGAHGAAARQVRRGARRAARDRPERRRRRRGGRAGRACVRGRGPRVRPPVRRVPGCGPPAGDLPTPRDRGAAAGRWPAAGRAPACARQRAAAPCAMRACGARSPPPPPAPPCRSAPATSAAARACSRRRAARALAAPPRRPPPPPPPPAPSRARPPATPPRCARSWRRWRRASAGTVRFALRCEGRGLCPAGAPHRPVLPTLAHAASAHGLAPRPQELEGLAGALGGDAGVERQALARQLADALEVQLRRLERRRRARVRSLEALG